MPPRLPSSSLTKPLPSIRVRSRYSTLKMSTTTTPIPHIYANKTFRPASNTSNGEVDTTTLFHYHQDGPIVWAEYAGGSIKKGSLIATVKEDGSLDMRYQHVNTERELMTGKCKSVPERMADGRMRLRERWTWTSGDGSSGESVLEEE